MSNNENPYWQDVAQDKKVPESSLSCSGGGEESDRTRTPSTERDRPSSPQSAEVNPPVQENGPGTSSTTPNTVHQRRNLRACPRMRWTAEEKKILLYCYE